MSNDYRPSRLMQEMSRVARACGDIMRRADAGAVSAAQKTSHRDLVTAFDTEIQAFAIAELSAAFPEAHFICEEGDTGAPSAVGLTFIIDPIDGTANFVHHLGHSCTSIACTQDARPIAGAVYNVYRDELFTAERGKGAYRNGERLHVFDGELADTIVMFGTSPYNPTLAEETLERLRSVYGRCQDVRRSGSAALDLCYTANGRTGLYFESELCLWDYAAGALIVEEAGGVFLTLEGQSVTYDRPHKCSGIAGSIGVIRQSGFLPEKRA